MAQTTRRQFVGVLLGSAVLPTAKRLFGAEKPNCYVRADTDWLAKCRFGIGIHWTAQTVPRRGSPKPFQKAVADFDLPHDTPHAASQGERSSCWCRSPHSASADAAHATHAHALLVPVLQLVDLPAL
jgi:hypothetical protein